MTIPVFRHNLDHDDWEVASVYDSDDSLGHSGSEDSGPLDNAGLHLPHDDTRFRFGYPMPSSGPPPPPHQNYVPAYPRPRRDARRVPAPGKAGGYAPPPPPIVPPPGVIFPPQDWVLPPPEAYWSAPIGGPVAPPPDMPAPVPLEVGPMEPPPPLLLAPASPLRASSPLVKRRPSPTTPTAIGHGHGHGPTHASMGTGNVNTHSSSPIKVLPPAYHELAHVIPPRLTEGGCQAHQKSAPRRAGHEVPVTYTPGAGHVRAQLGEDHGHVTMERHVGTGGVGVGVGVGTGGGHSNHGHGPGADLHVPPVPTKYERDREYARPRMARPQVRERRPSIWQRFVRRFSPSRASVGQT